MSIVLVGRALGAAGLSAQEKLLLVTLADAANEDGECWPGRVRIADRCCCSARHVGRLLERLAAAGFIAVHDRGPQTNLYTVFPACEDAQVTPDAGGVRTSETPSEDISRAQASAIPEPSVEPSETPRRPRSMLDEPGQSVDVDAVCEALADHVENVLGRERPTVTKGWRRSARLMLDGPGDKRPEWTREQLEYAIRWLASPGKDAQFWSVNVMSMDALRRQMFRLETAIKREHRERTTSGQPRQTLGDLEAMAERFRRAEAS